MKCCTHHDSTEGSTCTCIDFLGRSLAVGAARYHSLGEGTGGGKGGPNHGGGARRSGGPIPRERVWGALGRPRGDGEACRRTLTGGGGGRGGGPGGRARGLLKQQGLARFASDDISSFCRFPSNHGIRGTDRGRGGAGSRDDFALKVTLLLTKSQVFHQFFLVNTNIKLTRWTSDES